MDMFKPGDIVQFRPVEELEAHITKWFNEPDVKISKRDADEYCNEIYSFSGNVYVVAKVEKLWDRDYYHVVLKHFNYNKIIHPELLQLYASVVDDSIPDMFGEMVYEQKVQ